MIIGKILMRVWKKILTNPMELIQQILFVNYNKNSILAVTLVLDFSGAYPTTFSKSLVIDATTGKRVFLQDVFSDVGQTHCKN